LSNHSCGVVGGPNGSVPPPPPLPPLPQSVPSFPATARLPPHHGHSDPHLPPPSRPSRPAPAPRLLKSSCARHRCCCSRQASSPSCTFLFVLWLVNVAVSWRRQVLKLLFLPLPTGLGAFGTGLKAESSQLSAPHLCWHRSSGPVQQCTEHTR